MMQLLCWLADQKEHTLPNHEECTGILSGNAGFWAHVPDAELDRLVGYCKVDATLHGTISKIWEAPSWVYVVCLLLFVVLVSLLVMQLSSCILWCCGRRCKQRPFDDFALV